jgi:hypothetical protein
MNSIRIIFLVNLPVLMLAIAGFAEVGMCEPASRSFNQLARQPSIRDLGISDTLSKLPIEGTLIDSTPPIVRFLSFESSYSDTVPYGIESLLNNKNLWRKWQFVMSPGGLGKRLRASGTLGDDVADSSLDNDVEDQKRLHFKISTENQWDAYTFGANYRHGESSGTNYRHGGSSNDEQDGATTTQRIDVWGSRSWGNLSVRPSVSRFWKTPEKGPRSRQSPFVETQAGINIEYMFLEWPYLSYSLGYFQGLRESQRGIPTEVVNTIVSGLYYSSSSWTTSLSTSYSKSNSDASSPYTSISHDLSLSYPLTETMSFNAYASHASDNNRDWDLDSRSFYAEAGVIWNPKKSSAYKSIFSFVTSYDKYIDAIYSDSDYDNFSVWTFLKIEL